eukprot:TRINITY_DN100858_c0_g1_i1.p1 TRINITY_DN100858_c0_g1~~TRINITY_DN100858_c0_g1_i1.p1  ORF type:complete len:1243 (-),score=178.83 TRINITY_DN100858_c0_g1_i1:89-3817(-)
MDSGLSKLPRFGYSPRALQGSASSAAALLDSAKSSQSSVGDLGGTPFSPSREDAASQRIGRMVEAMQTPRSGGLPAGQGGAGMSSPRSFGIHGTSSNGGVESFGTGAAAAAAAASEDPFSRRRLAPFLTLHFAAFGASIAGMVNFAMDRHWEFFSLLLLPFLFSGLFCTCAAWHCRLPTTCPRILPLKRLRLPWALLLTLPLGFGQGIIVLCAIEDWRSQGKDGTVSIVSQRPAEERGRQKAVIVHKYHGKAVNGLFEGLLSSALFLYVYTSMLFPANMPITMRTWRCEPTFLAIVGSIQFCSAGLGLLELDYCTSKAIAQRMRHRSLRYEAIHWLFRVTEVTSRVSLFVAFMVFTRENITWWWCPLGVDFLVTIALVNVYGGTERTSLVRLLCSIPCSFANVFFFIDSPYKRGAAMRLSRWLTLKHAVALVVLPPLAYAVVDNFHQKAHCFWNDHIQMNVMAISATLLYWVLLWWVSSRSMHSTNMVDIYTACESGSVAAVRSAMKELTYSVAVGLNVNCLDINGHTPLMCAAVRGHADVCRLLLQEGARVDIRLGPDDRWALHFVTAVRRRWTALHMAAHRGHAEVVHVLLDGVTHTPHLLPTASYGSEGTATGPGSLEFADENGDTPLHVAACRGHADACRHLVQACPGWLESLNHNSQRPIDMVPLGIRGEQVREVLIAGRGSPNLSYASSADAILPDCEEGEAAGNMGRSSPLLAPRASSFFGGDLQSQAWPLIHLAIRRSVIGDSELIAPGLCSYIASNCGGALANLFLREARQRRHDAMLTIIDEAAESDETGTPGTSLCRRTLTPRSMTEAERGPAMEDLEPVDAQGKPFAWWNAAAQAPLLMSPFASPTLGPVPPAGSGAQMMQVAGGPMLPSSGAGSAVPSSCSAPSQGTAPSGAASHTAPLAPPHAVSGRMFVNVPEESILGEGSYGLVWRAKDRYTTNWYAVKNIKSQRGQLSVAARECQVADHIRLKPHPCLVRLFHVHHFADIGLYVLVMEFCSGGDVLGRIKARRRQAREQKRHYTPPQEAIRWIGQVFLGLEHLHLRMSTLLRDLKPENIVLSTEGHAKLTDFGFGRFGVESSGCWSFGIPTGSPGYVSPEVLRRENYGPSADLYSLGVLVWVLLTGGLIHKSEPVPPLGQMRHPTDFQAHFQDWLLLAQCVARPERNHARPLPEDASDFVAKLTHRAPDARMSHVEIRRHRLLQSLQLPAFDARPQCVEAWMEKMAGAAAVKNDS